MSLYTLHFFAALGLTVSTNSFSWLHLTDLHYGLTGQDCLWPNLRQPFLDDHVDLHKRCGPWDVVFFTGDLVQSGESAQFSKMQTEVLDPLWKRLDELGSGEVVLLAVPGNHDLFRPDPHADDPAAAWLLDEYGFGRIKEKFWSEPGGSYRRVIINALAAYSEWWGDAPHRPVGVKDGALPGDFSATLEVGEWRIGIIGLNTTFLQLAGGNYRKRLVWDVHQLNVVCDGGVDMWSRRHDVCLLLTHQGPEWLTAEAQKHGKTEIAPAGRFAVHLFGHQHELEIKYIRSGGSRNSVRLCQSCSVFGMEKFGDPPMTKRAHGYTAGRIEFGRKKATLRLWPRIATDKPNGWRFIPDNPNAELNDDQGTPPESVAVQARATAAASKKNETVSADRCPTATVPAVLATATTTLEVAVPHSTLPTRRPFFGRTKDLSKIAKYLLPEDRSWGVVLDGPGGVGKTALALEAAHRAPAEHFPLKLWITAKSSELRPTGEDRLTDHRVDDYSALLSELGQALGRDDIKRAVPEDRPNLARHALADHRALLVLDNLETFRDEERRRVFELLGNLPASCRAIVTSRRRSSGSIAAHTLRLDKLEREAADELLAELGDRWAPVARLSADERDRLYAETGGNPLLLTWTVGQLGRTTGRCRNVVEAIERLQEAHRLEQVDDKNDPLDFVFGDLVETFTLDETAVLAALVHFNRPAPIAWLLPLMELRSKAAETALDGLRDRALLVEDDEAATWLLPPLATRFLRRSCPEAVGVSGDRLAERTYALVLENGFAQFARFSVLEDAWPQLAAALPLLIQGDNRRLQTVCGAVRHFLDFSGRWDDLISLSSAAEAKAERAKDLANAGARAIEAGWMHYRRGQFAEVMACADRVNTHWKTVRVGARERATAISLRGLGHDLAKDFPAAVAAHRKALELTRSISPRSDVMSTHLSYLAATLQESGKFEEAETLYREALENAKSLTELDLVATLTASRAALALDREQWNEAERFAREALKMAREANRKELIARASWCLAKALARQGRGAEGRCHAELAVTIYTELRSRDVAKAQAGLDECLN